MNEATLVVLALLIFVWAVLARRIESHNISGPLLLAVGGFLLGNSSWGIVTVDVHSSTVHLLAEITLALLLFADASAVPLAAARQDLPLTARLLGIGLPLSIIGGTVLALLLFPSLPFALAGLIAASLAPTDAALSAPVIADERLPMGVRRVLNVESGLNDGMPHPSSQPSSPATVIGVEQHEFESGFGAIGELAIGVLVGAVVGTVGGLILRLARRREWIEHGSRQLATLSLALLAFLVASETGGNPFVAAFIGGLCFGASDRTDAGEAVEFTERAGSLLSLVLCCVRFVLPLGYLSPAFVRSGQLDGRANGPGGALIGSADRATVVLWVVRSAWFGVRCLRAARHRGTGRYRSSCAHCRSHDHAYDRVQHRGSRDHRPSARDPLRGRNSVTFGRGVCMTR